jgi:DNA-directed RNA polymerase beta subunit
MVAALGQRFGEMPADARAGACHQDRLLIVRDNGVRHSKDYDRGVCGNNESEKFGHGYSFLVIRTFRAAR